MFFNLKQFNWKLNFSVLFLGAMGLLSLASANKELFNKQIFFWTIGIALIFLIIKFDWRTIINYQGIILGFYFLIILLLALTYFFAPTIRGTRSWLALGPYQFQASEFAKIALIIIFANFFRKKHIGIARVFNLLVSFIYFSIPAALTLIQPDLGSVLVLFAIWFGFLLVSGISWRHLATSFLIFLAIGLFAWFYGFHDYQRERIVGVFLPERDSLGINYNVIQSKIAIGSAGLFGKGFKQGIQTQLGFLPEAQTDFIFASVIEEFGLLSGFLLIGAFALVVFEIIKIGLNSENNFNKFFCLGSVIFFIVQFVFNVGSNLGLTPVIGVTFPFLSYGGSSLLADLVVVGIIQSIVIRGELG